VNNTVASPFLTTQQLTCSPGYAIDPMNRLNNTVNTTCTQFGNWSTFTNCTGNFHILVQFQASI
jgi:hypothetical protein